MKYTPQETFDTVVNHLLTQNERSESTDPSCPMCLYRGPNGLKCAIGCLIPDDLYQKDMDNGNLGLNSVLLTIGNNGYPIHDFPYGELQGIHDQLEPECWPRALAELADEYDLIYNE